MLREKLIVSIKKSETAYSSSLIACLNALEPKEANAPQMIREQEIIKLRDKINWIETKRTIQRIKTRYCFFEKLSR